MMLHTRRMRVVCTLEKPPQTVAPAVKRNTKSVPSPAGGRAEDQGQRLVNTFSQHWLPKLLQQQVDANGTSNKVAQLGERLATGITSYQSKLLQVVNEIMAPVPLTREQQELLPPGCAEPPNLDLGLLMDVPGTQGSKSRLPPLRAKSPDVELATLVTAIQATNSKVREVDHMVEDANTNIVHLQDGADERDKVQQEVCSMLLEYAEELEVEEREMALRQAAWEAETKRLAAEQAAFETEQARIAQQQAEARRLAEENARLAAEEAARLAELNKPVPVPIKMDVGVHIPTKPGQDVVLIGSHPTMGSWSIDGALPLTWTEGHVWRASIELPPDCVEVEYKAVLRSRDAQVWEKGDNHKAKLQGSQDISLYHVFRD